MATTTLQERMVSLQELLQLPPSPPPAYALPAALIEVAAIDALVPRTAALHLALEELSATGEHVDALVGLWNAARHNDVAGQRLLVSLLEVRHSGLELLQAMILPSQSVRLCLRHAQGAQIHECGETITQRAWGWLAQVGIRRRAVATHPGGVVHELHRKAQGAIQQLLRGQLHPNALNWLRGLIETELEARAARLEHLAEQVGAYDGRRISRVLPHLSREEERIRDTRALMAQWPETDELRRRAPALLGLLEERHFDRLVEDIDGASGGCELAHTLRLLHRRVPVTRSLLFVAAALRAVDARLRGRQKAGLDGARSLMVALQVMQPDGRVRLGGSVEQMRRLRDLVARCNLTLVGADVLELHYDDERHRGLLAASGIAEFDLGPKRDVDDIRQLVLDNMQNEHILGGLLGSPRVISAPGLVETIVARTRSIKLLLEIANRRELHTGAANRNVPLALLSHPGNVPVSALRKFVHVRYVDRATLASMAGRGTRVRPEVRTMAAQYLKSIGNP